MIAIGEYEKRRIWIERDEDQLAKLMLADAKKMPHQNRKRAWGTVRPPVPAVGAETIRSALCLTDKPQRPMDFGGVRNSMSDRLETLANWGVAERVFFGRNRRYVRGPNWESKLRELGVDV